MGEKRRRILALLLSVVMAAVSICGVVPGTAFAKHDSEYRDYLDGWKVQCVWSNLETESVWNAEDDEVRQPKLMFTYQLENAGKDYPAGSLSVRIPGIGGAVRAQVEKASKLAVEQEDSEWSYTWDQRQDVYTFTSRFAVKQGQSVSGGFEMMWTLKARDCTDGYEQQKSPEFAVSGEGAITMEPLRFQFDSERDQYRIYWNRSRLTGAQAEETDQAYVWYEYRTRFDVDRCARGLYRASYFVSVELPDGAQYRDVKVISDGAERGLTLNRDGEWGFYPFRERMGDISSENSTHVEVFRIGFRRETLMEQPVSLHGHVSRLYQDEETWTESAGENETVDVEDSFSVENYGFQYAGYVYGIRKSQGQYEKPSTHAAPARYADRLSAVSLYSGQVVEFTLEGRADRSYVDADAEGRNALREERSVAGVHVASPSNVTLATLSDIDRVIASAEEDILLHDLEEHTEYALILGDDKLALFQNNGEIRELEDGEYDLSYVTVPSDSRCYDYEVYAAREQDTDFPEYELVGTGNTGTRQSIPLQAGYRALYVRVNGISGSYELRAFVGIRFHLDWEAEQRKPMEERVDHEERIVNFSLLRAVHEEERQNEVKDNPVDENSYMEVYGKKLSERDWSVYGEYQQRSYAHVWLRSPVTEVTARAGLYDFTLVGKERFETTVFSGGTIRAEENGLLETFSLYTVLPEGIYMDSDRDEIQISGIGSNLHEEVITEFRDHVTFRQDEWNGKTMIAADFDFSEEPLAIGREMSVSVSFPASLSYADYLTCGNRYRVTTYLMPHDGGMDRISGERIMSDEYDIDGDGITTEQMAYHMAEAGVSDDVTEWRGYSSKYVKSSYSDGYKQAAVAKRYLADGTQEEQQQALYDYRMDFGLGASNGKHIVMYDRIEQGATVAGNEAEPDAVTVIPSGWQGEFLSVDTTYAERMGMMPTVYYSTDANQELSLEAEGWSTAMPVDASSVRAVAVHLDTESMEHGVMRAGQKTFAVIHMRAPKAETLVGRRAVNQYTITYDAYDMESVFEKKISLDSSETSVKLLDTVGEIVLQKTDGDRLLRTDTDGTEHYAALPGAVFQVYDARGNPLFEETGRAVNAMGCLTVTEVPYGTYYYEELQAPAGYQKIRGRHEVRIDGVTEVLNIKNSRIPGEVILTKTDADDEDHAPLRGAEFELYASDGRKLFTDENGACSEVGTTGSFVTDDDGQIRITNLPWGSYRFVEIAAPDGYQQMNQCVEFRIGKAQYDPVTNAISVSVFAENQEKRTDVLLRKTDAEDGKTLNHACYDLYQWKRDGGDEKGWVQIRQSIKTNAAGELMVTGLLSGTYQFREVLAPRGYKISENHVTFTLDAEHAGETYMVVHADERKKGSVVLQKTSEDGFPLKGAVYALYRESNQTPERNQTPESDQIPESDQTPESREWKAGELVMEDLVTDEAGRTLTVTELTWGDYYFVETKAPKGYVADPTPIRFTVDAEQVELTQQVEAVNRRDRGRVKLLKLDAATGTVCLPGAQFGLYKNDGSEVQSGLVTDADGCIYVENLDWGSYYFEEKKAPDGYGICTDKIRFSVNEDNCTMVQQVVCHDPVSQVQIRIRKEINEQYGAFGLPVFIYRISGKDVNETEHTWIKSITLDNTTTGETVLGGIPAGIYTIAELESSRYSHVTVIAGPNADTVAGGGAVVDLTTEKEAEVTFCNEMTQYEKLSHMTSAVNMVSAQKKLTGFSVTYRGPAVIRSEIEDSYAFTADDLDATVSYDDGTSEAVSFADLVLDPGSVTGNFNTSGAGYTVHVSYTENGQTLQDSFSVEIQLQPPMDAPRVIFDANGGYFGGDPNRVVHQVYYQPGFSWVEDEQVKKTAKTSNVTEDGSNYHGEYGNNRKDLETITIPGSDRLHVKITYQTQNTAWDWVCVYPGDVEPSSTNYDESISGRLGGTVKQTKEYDVDGDTVKFYFISNNAICGYYGYYAEVTGVIPGHDEACNFVLAGEYQEPEHPSIDGKVEFAGWYTDAACSPGNEFDPTYAELGERITVYAKWDSYYQVTFELNGGTIVPDGGGSAVDTLSYWCLSGESVNAPKNKPVNGKYVFWGWYPDESFVTKVGFPAVVTGPTTCYAYWGEYTDVKYAVSLYAIRRDDYREEDGTTGTAGLTFGPATGKYLESYVCHEPSGLTKNGNPQRCIHWDDWGTIAMWSQKDPYVYEKCLGDAETRSCTRAVPLMLNDLILRKAYPELSGDGAGMLYFSAKVLDWNAYNDDNASTIGGWPASRIRATLNGADAFTNKMIDGSDAVYHGYLVAGTAPFDRSQSLLSCFPRELQDAIVPRRVQSDTVPEDTLGNNLTTFDKLWLFSANEWFSGGPRPNEGTPYIRNQPENWRREVYSENVQSNIPREFWLRSSMSDPEHARVSSYGGIKVNAADSGLSPGFCLK